jgi:hypothetical protein
MNKLNPSLFSAFTERHHYYDLVRNSLRIGSLKDTLNYLISGKALLAHRKAVVPSSVQKPV